jgi:hypothetical protein
MVGLIGLTLVGALTLAPATTAIAAGEPTDTVLGWNLNALNALSNPTIPVVDGAAPGAGQGPPASAIHMAMVQGAVYDAVNAIDGGHQPYLAGLPAAPATASKAAAASQAAYAVLVGLVPSLPQVVKDDLALRLADTLDDITDGQAKSDGIAIGTAAATAMLAARADDGRFGSHTWTTGTEPGQWRLVPPANASLFAWAGNVTPFTLERTDQYRTEGPLDLASAEYAAEFNEVKAKGAQTGSTRTEEETLLARFVSANPLPFMNRGLRDIATERGLSPAQQARLLVTTNMAGADALINCWDDKDHWSFWRPQTAIREAGNDGNAATEPQADWLSFFPTPGYPDHPSGYNCYTGAMMHSASFFFGTDKVSFDLTSPGTTPATTRHYERFSDVVRDTIDGRILTGFHFRTPDVQGAWIGKKVAQWVDRHFFDAVH